MMSGSLTAPELSGRSRSSPGPIPDVLLALECPLAPLYDHLQRAYSPFDRQGRHFSGCQVDESAIIGNFPAPEQAREHRQSMVGKSLVNERFLALESFDGTA